MMSANFMNSSGNYHLSRMVAKFTGETAVETTNKK
jgi:hypothetical protein